MWNLELLSSFLGSKIQFLLRPGYVESTFFYCKRSNDSKNVELDRPSITRWPKLLNFDQKYVAKSEIIFFSKPTKILTFLGFWIIFQLKWKKSLMIFGHNFETSVIVISYIQDKKYYKWLNHFLKSYRLNVNHSTM